MILQFIKKYERFLDKPITQEEVNDIVYYGEKGWYLQIIKQYGIVICLILMEYYKFIEDYIKCKDIVDAIENSNQHFGTTHPKTLEDYVSMSKLLQ